MNLSWKQAGARPVQRHARSGFTLVELLVVLAIVSILAAILLPVIGRVRDRARATSCLSNMRQIGMGLMMYLSDKSEHFPPYIVGQYAQLGLGQGEPALERVAGKEPATKPGERFVLTGYGVPGDKPAHYKTWMDCLDRYTKSVTIYTCPSHRQDSIDLASPSIAYFGDPAYYDQIDNSMYMLPSLGYNAAISNIYGSTPNLPAGLPVSSSDINGASSKVFLQHDRSIYDHETPSYYYARSTDAYGAAPGGASVQFNVWPHADGSPLVFCDGHTKWVSRKQAGIWSCEAPLTLVGTNGIAPSAGITNGDNIRGCGYWTPQIPPPG
jgi:prepilin-type N-terminal cleavage/methylation domain-containing protein